MLAVQPPFSPRSARAAQEAKSELAGKPSFKHEGAATLASTLPTGTKRKKKVASVADVMADFLGSSFTVQVHIPTSYFLLLISYI